MARGRYYHCHWTLLVFLFQIWWYIWGEHGSVLPGWDGVGGPCPSYNGIRPQVGAQKRDINSLAPGKFEWHFRYLSFQIISVIDGWVISCQLALRWMSLDLTDDKSTFVQVMAWCCQATSHYLSQCWPRSLSSYGVTRPQWVNPFNAKLFSRNMSIYFHQFLSVLHTDMTQVGEIISHGRQGPTYSPVNIMGADVLAMQGSRVSAAMILT